MDIEQERSLDDRRRARRDDDGIDGGRPRFGEGHVGFGLGGLDDGVFRLRRREFAFSGNGRRKLVRHGLGCVHHGVDRTCRTADCVKHIAQRDADRAEVEIDIERQGDGAEDRLLGRPRLEPDGDRNARIGPAEGIGDGVLDAVEKKVEHCRGQVVARLDVADIAQEIRRLECWTA